MELENLIKTTIEEALPEFGIDELCALLAARIEYHYRIIDREQRGGKASCGPLLNRRLLDSLDISE
jgi:hypothetical protein